MPENAIEIENLSFNWPDGTRALRDISLHINRGENLGIIGANGAGKSTLLLHLNGILGTNGEVIIDGLPVSGSNRREISAKVGLVFQNPYDQLFSLSVYDDVAFGPVNMGLAREEIEKRVTESLKVVGLSGFENRNPFHLSIGEKKRAAIATVLSMHPEILVLDEPSSSLDPGARRELIELLKSLEMTMVIASHDLDLVARLCGRIAVMKHGTIVRTGSPEVILNDRNFLRNNGLA